MKGKRRLYKSFYNAPHILSAFAVALLLLLVQSCQVLETAQDIEVIDGDTFRYSGKTVRVIGIDAPETYSGSSKPVGEYGQDAKQYLYWFVANHEITIEVKGVDNYGRTLAYVFGKDRNGKTYFYEASVTELGYARPLFYSDNYVADYGKLIISAYRRAFEQRRGIYSKFENAPILTNESANWVNYVGKIVFLEMNVTNVFKYTGVWYILSDFAVVKLRDEEYRYIFENFNLYNLRGRKVRFYGELWNDEGKPTILIRAPWEIVVVGN